MMQPPPAKRIEAIFMEAVELPPTQREAFLDLQCGNDPELRKRVERLLQADAANTDGTLGGALVEFATEQIPSQVGPYKVDRIAGEGGMGAVYDAIHSTTNRRAAVKLVRAGISTMRGRERLRIEAESLSRLSDPGIAQIYDAGVAEVIYPDGVKSHRPFIAMEFVEGISIIDFAKSRSLSMREKLDLVHRVLLSVHHAHQRGVIHRDLKPSNILIKDDGSSKIVDFGIARIADATGESITATGQVIGTLRYMSPEQAAGDQSKIDVRTDVYSIGSIVYELLAGKPLVELSAGSTLAAAVNVLSAVQPDLSRCGTEIPDDLIAIVNKAIDRDLSHRYSSADAFADDLHRFLNGLEVSARSPGTIEKFIRVVKRNKPLSAAISLAVLAIIIGGGIAIWQARVATHQALLAQQEAKEKAKALDEAQTALGYLTDVLASCTPERDGRDARVLDVALKAANDIEARFKDQPLVLASVRLALGRTFLSLGKAEDGFKQVDAAYAIRKKLLGEDDRLSIEAENALNEASLYLGRGLELDRNFDRPPKWFEDHLGPEDRETLRAKLVLAESHSQFDRNDIGFAIVEDTYNRTRKAYGPEDEDTIAAANEYASWLLYRRGEPRRAADLLRDILQIETRKYGATNARTLSTTRALASAAAQVGRYDEAITLLEQTLPTIVEIFGENHPESVMNMRVLATCYRETAKMDPAQQMYDRAIAASIKAFGEDGRTETTRIRMAEMWLDQGRTDEAEKLIRDVLHRELFGNTGGGNFAITLVAESRVLLIRKRPQDAMLRLEAAMSCIGAAKTLDRQTTSWADVAYWMGLCLQDLNRPADAARCLRDAATVYERCLGADAPQTTRTRKALACIPPTTQPTTQPLVGWEIAPHDLIWFSRFGEICMNEGDPATAVVWYQRAIYVAKSLKLDTSKLQANLIAAQNAIPKK